MPIGRFFCVMAPLLAAFMWFVASSMEPTPPPRTQAATKALAANATSPVSKADASGRFDSAVRPEPPAASPQTSAQEAHATNLDSGLAAPETSGSAAPAVAPKQTQKHNGRKRVAQRPTRQKTYASTARHPNYFPYENAAHAGYQPARPRPFGRGLSHSNFAPRPLPPTAARGSSAAASPNPRRPSP
jgi:hypothetical protein